MGRGSNLVQSVKSSRPSSSSRPPVRHPPPLPKTSHPRNSAKAKVEKAINKVKKGGNDDIIKIPVPTFEFTDDLTPLEGGKDTNLVVKVGRRNGSEGGRANRDSSSPIVSPTPMQTSKINPPTKMGAPVKRPFTKSAKSRKLSGAGRWTGGNNDRRTNSNNKKKYDGGKGSGVEPDSSGSSAANDGGEEEGGMSLDEQYRMEKEEMEELSNTRLNFARALGAFKPTPTDVSATSSTDNTTSQQPTDVNDNGTSINSNSGNADVRTSEVSQTSIPVDNNRAATLSACVSLSLHLTSLLSLLRLRHTRPTVRVVSESLLQQHGVRWSEVERVFLGVAGKFYLKKDGEIKEWDRWKEDVEDGCSRKEALQRHFSKLESLSAPLPSFTSDSTETKSNSNAKDGTSSKTTSTASSSGANKKKSTTSSSSREAIGKRILSSMISPPVLLSTTAGTTMPPPSSSSLPSQPFTLDSTNSTIEERVLARGMAMTNMRNKHENNSRDDVVKDGKGRVEKRDLLRMAECLKSHMRKLGRKRAGMKELKKDLLPALIEGGRINKGKGGGKGGKKEVERRIRIIGEMCGKWIEVGEDYVKVNEREWEGVRVKLGGREQGGGGKGVIIRGMEGIRGYERIKGIGKERKEEGKREEGKREEGRKGGGKRLSPTPMDGVRRMKDVEIGNVGDENLGDREVNIIKGRKKAKFGDGGQLGNLQTMDNVGRTTTSAAVSSHSSSLIEQQQEQPPPPPRVNSSLTFESNNSYVSTRYGNIGGNEQQTERRTTEEIGDDKSKRGLKRLFNNMMKGRRLKD